VIYNQCTSYTFAITGYVTYLEAQDNGVLVIEGTNIKNFNAAKHRAESTRTPLGRMIIFFDATLATAVMIYKERRIMDKPGRSAHKFLSYIEEENLLQCAMLADASDEHMGLLRFHDNEAFDEAASPQEVATFLDRVHFLFIEKACLKSGYTRAMLKMLEQPRTFYLDGQLKTVGGPRRALHADGSIVVRCMNRMKNWVFLAKLTLEAEFPTFAVSHAFEIFNLQPYISGALSLRRVADAETPDVRRDRAFNIFANTLGLDKEKLEEEFCKHLPSAIRFMATGSCTNFEAWQRASDSLAKKAATACPMNTLRLVLMRYGSFGGSTSGVEQTFAKQVQIAPPSRSELSEGRANDELTLLSADACDDDTLLSQAREIWSELYGSVRTAERELRCDTGAQKAFSNKPKMTEAKFLRERRAEVSELMNATPLDDPACLDELPAAGTNGWTERHDREALFQINKKDRRVLDALQHGNMDVSEVDVDVAARLAAALDEEAKTDYRYFQELRRREHALTRKTPPDFKDMPIYINDDLNPEDLNELGASLRSNRFRTTTDRLKAKIIAVSDPTHPGQRNLWCAMLKGILVASPGYVKTLGKQGTALKFKGQINRRRSVRASPRCKDKHPVIFNLIFALSQQPGSK